jgi:agmatine deiminase
MPAEFDPHERTVICWPCRSDLYGELLDEARSAHAEVARAVARFEPVTMIARPGADAADAAERCGGAAEIVELPIDDSWFRDTGPIYVIGDESGELVATDWVFNGWGGKFEPFDADADVARRWAELAGHEVRSIPTILEGGAINVDGQGTLVTTAQCLLHPNRNSGLTRTEIENALCAELGVTVVHWLPFGLADDDDTDGHVDNVAAFAQPGRLVLQGCDDPDEADFERMSANRRWIEGAPDAAARPIDVVEVPVLPFAEIGGERVPVPYLNYYLGNGFVLVPVCGHDADADMCAIIAEQYPGREIVPLDVGAILAFGGGGIHCITQQIPRISDRREQTRL